MTEKAAEAETPPADTTPEPQDGAEGSQAPADTAGADDAESVSEARRNGWKPLADFKGDPQTWIDHKAFNERGREILPIVKAQNKRLEKEIADLKKTVAEVGDYASKAEQRGREQAMRELEARLDQAVVDNDGQEARKVAREIASLEADKPAPKGEAAEKALLDDWKTDNAWFETDEDMTIYAKGVPVPEGMPFSDQLRLINEKVRKAFPHKFENPRRNGPGAVESPTGNRKPAGKTFSDLPPDAKAMCQRFEKIIPNFTRDKYVKDYFAEAK